MSSAKETKIIYHIDDEETPYLVKINKPPEAVTLSDFKNVLNRPNFKFFFKSMDDDFGIVKEEIIDDSSHLPCINGRVVSWLVSADGSTVDGSQCGDLMASGSMTDLPHHHHHPAGDVTETDSSVSRPRAGGKLNGHPLRHRDRQRMYDNSSMLSSELDSTSFFDSDDDGSSRITTTTGSTSVSRVHRRHRRRRPRGQRAAAAGHAGGAAAGLLSRTSSYSSITDSTMTLNIITVTLNMDTVSFLGISIVGQSNKGGDGGIYVGSIMKGGAVALDGRIEPGDMILQVNDVNFENMSNDDAVHVLRDVVQKPGPVKLVVAKCWDNNPKGYFTLPRTEPVRPIDPGAWVAHTAACREYSVGVPSDYATSHRKGTMIVRQPSLTTLTSASSSIVSSVAESQRALSEPLTVDSGMLAIARCMAAPDSALEVRDRMWLKINIPNAFIGSDVVDWLYSYVTGFSDRREARKYTAHMLRGGFIRHTVNKNSFSEQCYYVFGDLSNGFGSSCGSGEDGYSDALPPPSAPLSMMAAAASAPCVNAPWGGSTHAPYSGSFPYSGETSTFHPRGPLLPPDTAGSGSGGSSASSQRRRLIGGVVGGMGAGGSTTDSSDASTVQSLPRCVPPPPPPSSGGGQPPDYFVDVM